MASGRTTGKWRFKPLRLEMRFGLFLGAMMLLVAIAASLILVDASGRQSRQHVRAVVTELARAVAVSLGESMDGRDPVRAEKLIQRLESFGGLAEVRVVDERGVLVAAFAGPRRSAPRKLLEQVEAAIPTPEGQPAGRVLITVDRSVFARSGGPTLMAAMAVIFTLLALTALLTMAFVRRAIAPLRQLTAFAEQVSAHRLSEIRIETGDEFETLARAFNHMIARMESSMRRIQHLAFVDAATGLPNNERLNRELKAAIDNSAAAGAPGVLFLLSLERMLLVTETLGQEAGRHVLVAASQSLTAAVKASDPWGGTGEGPAPVIARLPSNEFAVLYPVLPRGVDLRGLAQALKGAFSEAVLWREHRITLCCVTGAAFFPRDGRTVDTVLRHARLARNAAREAPDQVRFFNRLLDRAANARLNLEKEIRAALEENQFKAHFQPKLNLRTGRIEGAEALARWERPDKTIVGPGKFIPAAEEMGLIGPISEAILRDACWKAAAWSREGLSARVAVNVSALQFADEKFPEKVMAILDQAGLPSACLELEITESVAMADVDRALRLIEPLRARGVAFSIDDFGTGHSSLAALTRLPFKVLKIDQSFIRGLTADRHAPAIVETILAMAAALDYEVIAEGVETEDEAEFLRRRGCPVAQGFLYSAAVPPGEYLRMLREGVITPARRDKGAVAAA